MGRHTRLLIMVCLTSLSAGAWGCRAPKQTGQGGADPDPRLARPTEAAGRSAQEAREVARPEDSPVAEHKADRAGSGTIDLAENRLSDPAEAFIRQMDAAPPDQRPPDWATTRRLMSRPAPGVGERAPDFTLKTPDGLREITRSEFHEGRPLVLLFGSFT